MSTTHLPTTTTSYIHLRPQINRKLNYYFDNHHKKKSRPYFKFQAGSTTTFSGYTNINSLRNKNEIYHQQHQTTKYNINRSKLSINNGRISSTNNYIPPLMNNDTFRYPPQKNRRTIAHAQQFQYRRSVIIHDNNDHYNNNKSSTLNKLNGLILSDSICKHVRAEKLSSMQLHVKLSFESGCTCNRMSQFLKQQTKINNNDIFEANFVVYSLCTNDVANIGAIAAIKQCRELINLTRELFPKLQTIGWIALSPRSKPSRLYDSEEIGKHYHHFNQLLAQLGKEMNFDIIYTHLQMQHLHIDGLHPSISSGRNLIENALLNWFKRKINMLTNSKLNKIPIPIQYTTTTYANKEHSKALLLSNKHKDAMIPINKQHNNNKNVQYNDKNKNYIQSNKEKQQKRKIFNHHDDNNNNNENIKSNDNNTDNQTSKEKLLHIPGKTLIPHYPHFLRHKEEFLRKIKIPEELENNKDDIFTLSNLHFQAEYFKSEADKWKIYMIAAKKKNKTIQQIEPMEIIIEENNSLPIPRPSPTGLAGPPALLDFTDLAEIFDEWLPEPIPGQKRKIGHRRDDPPTPPSPRQPPPVIPPSPRQPPPIIPRRTLPPRDPEQPLIGGSFHQSPNVQNTHKQHHSFNSLLQIEKQHNSPIRNRLTTNDPSMIISPIESSTPEPVIKSPSVVSKNPINQHDSFNFTIIPIECRYHFKKTKQKCTFEAIKIHQEFLERKYKNLEEERENKLHTSFARQIYSQVIDFIQNIVKKPMENKKNSDRKRLDNLLLDQMRKKATFTIEEKGTSEEQQYIHNLHERYMRRLNLQLQLDKLEKSFPPQANNKALIMNNAETRILNLGPKFVPPAPQQVLERLPKEIENMKEKIGAHWRRVTNTIRREVPLVNKFCQKIEDVIKKTVTTEAPQDPAIEPTIKYLQKMQKQNKIIFRQTDKSKVFHADNHENYIKKSELYMNKTNAYIEIPTSPLKEMIETTDKFLRNLVSMKKMPQSLLDKLRPSMTESELPHLYYNPKDHKIGEPLRPI
ncbi:unnamed protein product, partial [Rotaria sordida]